MAYQREHRAHTGRKRNEAARWEILRACIGIVRGGKQFTMDAIAQEARVGKQTLYRWWPSKGAVLAEAMAQRAQAIAGVPDTGTIREDLAAFLTDTFVGVTRPANARMLREVMAGAQQDPHLAEAVAAFAATRRRELLVLLERGKQRRELPVDADLDIVIDQTYGFLWYRLLLGHAPLDKRTAHRLADSVIATAKVC